MITKPLRPFQWARGLFLALTLLWTPLGFAGLIDQIDVSIAKGPDESHFIEGHFMTDASLLAAWDTLSDYNGIDRFVSSIRKSQRLLREDTNIVVEQVMVGKVGMFHKKTSVLLEIIETKPYEILFRDVSKKSFRSYSGSWKISQWDNGVAITYKLYVTPDFFAPDFIADGIFKKNVRSLLEEVQQEMVKRTNAYPADLKLKNQPTPLEETTPAKRSQSQSDQLSPG